MFFTKAGRVVASLTFGLALLHIAYLMVFAWQNSAKYPGFQAAFNLDMALIGASIALGILTEISKSLEGRSDQ